jgi:hypothetical protein
MFLSIFALVTLLLLAFSYPIDRVNGFAVVQEHHRQPHIETHRLDPQDQRVTTPEGLSSSTPDIICVGTVCHSRSVVCGRFHDRQPSGSYSKDFEDIETLHKLWYHGNCDATDFRCLDSAEEMHQLCHHSESPMHKNTRRNRYGDGFWKGIGDFTKAMGHLVKDLFTGKLKGGD